MSWHIFVPDLDLLTSEVVCELRATLATFLTLFWVYYSFSFSTYGQAWGRRTDRVDRHHIHGMQLQQKIYSMYSESVGEQRAKLKQLTRAGIPRRS